MKSILYSHSGPEQNQFLVLKMHTCMHKNALHSQIFKIFQGYFPMSALSHFPTWPPLPDPIVLRMLFISSCYFISIWKPWLTLNKHGGSAIITKDFRTRNSSTLKSNWSPMYIPVLLLFYCHWTWTHAWSIHAHTVLLAFFHGNQQRHQFV